jgi:serine protease AprX
MTHPQRITPPRVRLGLVCLLLAALMPTTVFAQTGSGKLDTVLRERATRLLGRSRVIVEFQAEPDVRVFGHGAVGRRVGAHAQVGELDNFQLPALAADARVARVMIDRPAFPTLERTAAAIGATGARQDFGVTGRGVGVAIIDSGITSYHDDLYSGGSRNIHDSRIVHFKDFTHPASTNALVEHPSDDYGHGTHVAGIIAGNGTDSAGARTGIAPGANLIGLRVLDAEGHGYISDVIAAIDYAISIKSAYNVRIINLSVASAVVESYLRDPLTLAARRASEAGIVVVAAAGNLGYNDRHEAQFGAVTSPGNAPWVLTVGSTTHQGTARRSDDAVAPFSSRGPTWIDFIAKPDLLAPGVGIESLTDPHSTLYSTMPEYLLDGTVKSWYKPYLSLTGTSMSAPVVSATVALMLEANPHLTPNAVKAILHYTAQTIEDEDTLVQGAGMLNARGAVRMAGYFAAPARGLGAMADTIAGESVPWARHLLWGNYLVTGGIPLPGSNAWALDVMWGALKTPSGKPVAWGAHTDESIVWSTAADDDSSIVWSTATGDDESIVWSTAGGVDESIVWSTAAGDDTSIVWSTAIVRNVVWGGDCGGRNCRNVKWGARARNGAVWGTADDDASIVWSTASADDESIVWSTAIPGDDTSIVWSTAATDDESIVWSTSTTDQVVWPASVQ